MDDVDRSVILVRELVDQAGGTMGRVIIRTRQDSQEAFLSFSVPASVLDGALASMVGDGVVLHREVESDGRLRQGERGEDLQARVTVNLQTYRESELWRSTGVLVAGGILVFLGIAGTLGARVPSETWQGVRQSPQDSLPMGAELAAEQVLCLQGELHREGS